jgi:LPXTG-motif cell wall-anchored protein
MRILRFVVLVTIAVLAYIAVAQTGVPSVAPSLKILAPKNGESISTDFVTVQYELASPVSAASTPTFQLRLDNRDPVETSDTQHTFTGVPAGTHTISVQLVDANKIPIPGVQNQVQFTVQPQRNVPSSSPGRARVAGTSGVRLQLATMSSKESSGSQSVPQAANPSATGDKGLPNTGSPLPLLSVIGMGVLVGGVASALRTRSRSGRAR